MSPQTWEVVKGRTRAGLLRLYNATADESNAPLLELVEEQAKRGFKDLRLANDPDTDATAIIELRQAIQARRQARLAKRPELVQARDTLAALDRDAVTATLRQHVRSGRGIAVRPRARALRLPAVR